MDKIIIKDLEIFAYHGVFEEEAVNGQPFLVCAEIEADLRRPGLTDELESTLNYGEICRDIEAFLTQNRFQLIESCAEQLAEHLLFRYAPLMHSITLEIKKPEAPIGIPFDVVSVKITRGWHTAILALGSNMGDRKENLDFAVSELKKNKKVIVDSVSSFIETEPYGYTDQDTFLNGACMIRTTLMPEELLDECLRIEADAKRVRVIHWGPRTLDVDILAYDREVISSPRLNVPHPDMQNRGFVLIPLAEIAPWWTHPVFGKTSAQMLADLKVR